MIFVNARFTSSSVNVRSDARKESEYANERRPLPRSFDVKISKSVTSVNSGGAAFRMHRYTSACVTPDPATNAISRLIIG